MTTRPGGSFYTMSSARSAEVLLYQSTATVATWKNGSSQSRKMDPNGHSYLAELPHRRSCERLAGQLLLVRMGPQLSETFTGLANEKSASGIEPRWHPLCTAWAHVSKGFVGRQIRKKNLGNTYGTNLKNTVSEVPRHGKWPTGSSPDGY